MADSTRRSAFGRPMPAVGVSLDLDTIAEVPL